MSCPEIKEMGINLEAFTTEAKEEFCADESYDAGEKNDYDCHSEIIANPVRSLVYLYVLENILNGEMIYHVGLLLKLKMLIPNVILFIIGLGE